jgi:hypothetical protein
MEGGGRVALALSGTNAIASATAAVTIALFIESPPRAELSTSRDFCYRGLHSLCKTAVSG